MNRDHSRFGAVKTPEHIGEVVAFVLVRLRCFGFHFKLNSGASADGPSKILLFGGVEGSSEKYDCCCSLMECYVAGASILQKSKGLRKCQTT